MSQLYGLVFVSNDSETVDNASYVVDMIFQSYKPWMALCLWSYDLDCICFSSTHSPIREVLSCDGAAFLEFELQVMGFSPSHSNSPRRRSEEQ